MRDVKPLFQIVRVLELSAALPLWRIGKPTHVAHTVLIASVPRNFNRHPTLYLK